VGGPQHAAASRLLHSQLCMVSLSLFRTLLSLNCEDVMLQLVLRYCAAVLGWGIALWALG